MAICRNQIYQITGRNCRQLIIIESNLNQTISSKLVSMFICCSSILACNFNHWAITNCRFQTGNVWPQCWFLSYFWWSRPGWQGCHNVNSFICLKNSLKSIHFWNSVLHNLCLTQFGGTCSWCQLRLAWKTAESMYPQIG